MRLIDADELYEAFKNGLSDTQEEKDFNQVGRYLVRHAPTVDVSVSYSGCEVECDSKKTYKVFTTRAEDLRWILSRYFDFGKTYFTTQEAAEAIVETKK